VYNEQESVPLFYGRQKAALEPLTGAYNFQILFTNNCSGDSTLDIIRQLHEQDPSVEILTLSRNFGYQASVLAGLYYARGDAMIVIDVDCEDPPEMVPQFITEWEVGNDIVYGIRQKRQEFIAIQWARKLFYRLLSLTADSNIILDMAEFALISARVRDHVIDNASTFPFIRTEIGYVGFRRKGIPYERQRRIHGRTHYNFVTMTEFAIGGILTSSTYALRMAAFSGAILLPLNLVLLVLYLAGVLSLAFHLLVSLDLMYLVFFVAVIAVYVARIYKNNVSRPVFIVDWQKSILKQRREASRKHW
jgi:dolichol-phosphate mannosyltransferase